MPPLHDPRQNHLLAALPEDEYARIGQHLDRVPLPLGQALYEPDRVLVQSTGHAVERAR